MGRLRSLLASVRDPVNSAVPESPITTSLRALRGSIPEERARSPDEHTGGQDGLVGSPRSTGAVHALAVSFAAELGVTQACRRAFASWSMQAAACRRRHIGLVWWAHAAAAATVRVWRATVQHWRVAGAAYREALWTAAARALVHWRLRAFDARALRLGRLAGHTSRVAQVLRTWAHLCDERSSWRTGKVISACAQSHSRGVALRRSLAAWRLDAVRAHIRALDTRRVAWRPHAMRRAWRVWHIATAAAPDMRCVWYPMVRAALRTWHATAAVSAWHARAAGARQHYGIALTVGTPFPRKMLARPCVALCAAQSSGTHIHAYTPLLSAARVSHRAW